MGTKSRMSTLRLSYIDTEMLEKMPWISMNDTKIVHSLTVGTSNSNYVLPTLLKLIHTLSRGSLNFSVIFYNSGIRMKSKFLKYLKLSIELGFIKKSHKERQKQFYIITDKGHQLLDMFYIE